MAKMSACLSCQQHYFRNEAACPHCGSLTPAANPIAGLAHRVRMGGLMLFTALTTTACYGTPAPPGVAPGGTRTTVEEPKPQVPPTAGKANLFITPKDEAQEKRVVTIDSVTLKGNMLVIKGNGLTLEIEAKDDTVFKSFEGIKAPLNVEDMKVLTANVSSTAPGKATSMYTFDSRSDTALKGTLQLSSFEQENVGGTLRIENERATMELYFHAVLSTQ